MLGVGWGAERPGTSIVVVADGPEPLRSDIRLPLIPIRKICVKTCTLGVLVLYRVGVYIGGHGWCWLIHPCRGGFGPA